MKAWFLGLQWRERWIVGVGAAAAIAIVFWGFVVRPVRAEIETLRTSVDTKQRLLVDVARIEGAQPAGVAGNRQGANQTLVVIVDNTARSHGLDLPRTRANGPSGVDVTFQMSQASREELRLVPDLNDACDSPRRSERSER